jgi:hypothetical protein
VERVFVHARHLLERGPIEDPPDFPLSSRTHDRVYAAASARKFVLLAEGCPVQPICSRSPSKASRSREFCFRYYMNFSFDRLFRRFSAKSPAHKSA